MSIRILIIDDTPEILDILSAYLAGEGYDIITATNGIEALKVIELTPVSLIISDIMMPQMGGFEFIEKYRKLAQSQKVPIIVASSQSWETAIVVASELGANGFLQKPVNLDALSRLVESSLCKAFAETTADYDEKRKHRRVPYFCEASFQGVAISSSTIISSLSKGGCHLDFNYPLPAKEVITLQIKLLPNYTIEVQGLVCYSVANSGIGVQFLDLDSEAEEIIDNIVERISNIHNIFELEYNGKYSQIMDHIIENIS